MIESGAPDVSSTIPADSATGVLITSTIIVEFDEDMDTSSITTNTTNASCSGSIQVSSASNDFATNTCIQMNGDPTSSSDNTTFTVTPANTLSNNNTTYKIRVKTTVKDPSGNTMDNQFETGTGFTTEK
jgi:hypothetical protein